MSKFTKSSEYVFVLFLFLGVSLLFFNKVIFGQGIIVGHDWMLPYNLDQMERYIERPFFSWIYDMNLFGVKSPFFIQLPFMILVKIFVLLRLSGESLSKFMVLFVFSLSGLSIYTLLKFLKLRKLSSFLGGLIMITMPFFFNYTIMGWCFVLFSVGIVLPISIVTFVKSVEENNLRYSVLTGILFSIGVLQSQSLVWFPLVFLALSISLVNNRQSFFVFIRSFVLVLVICVLLHVSWWPSLFLYKDQGVINSDLALDSVSLGMRSRLTFVNLLRGWGGLFNNQYEISYRPYLLLISFLFPFMALLSVCIRLKQQKDIRSSLLVIFSYMFLLFAIDPKLMARIPLSNIIRDTGRFTALTSLSIAILASYFIDMLLIQSKKIYRYVLCAVIFLLFLNCLPFIDGSLFSEPKNIYDVRLRNLEFSRGYSEAEKYLYTQQGDSKAYYPPSGTNIGLTDNPNFNGDFKEVKDPFRGYSPLPGTIYMYYSSMGKPTKVSEFLDQSFSQNNSTLTLKQLGLLNIQYLIYRENIAIPADQINETKSIFNNYKKATTLFEDVKILNNPYLVPHFYIPDRISVSNSPFQAISALFLADQPATRPAVFEDKYLSDLQTDEILNEALFVAPGVHQVVAPVDGEYEVLSRRLESNNFTQRRSLGFTKSDSVNKDLIPKIKLNWFQSQTKDVHGLETVGKIKLSSGTYKIEDLLTANIHDSDVLLLRHKFESKNNETNKLPQVTFHRINQTKYRIEISNAKESFPLIFSESFHPGWKVYVVNSDINLDKADTIKSYFDNDVIEKKHSNNFLNFEIFETLSLKPFAETQHLQVNGYANSWIINPGEIGKGENFSLIIEFLPQRYFYLGLLLSLVVFASCFLYLLSGFYKSKK